MDFGQFAALAAVVGFVLAAAFASYLDDDKHPYVLRSKWKRNAAYFGMGVFVFGVISCIWVASGLSVNVSF